MHRSKKKHHRWTRMNTDFTEANKGNEAARAGRKAEAIRFYRRARGETERWRAFNECQCSGFSRKFPENWLESERGLFSRLYFGMLRYDGMELDPRCNRTRSGWDTRSAPRHPSLPLWPDCPVISAP